MNKLKNLNKNYLIIILVVLIIVSIIVNIAYQHLVNSVAKFINEKAIAVYETQQVRLPSTFKTIQIDLQKDIYLGTATYSKENYFCIHSTQKYSDIFYYPYTNEPKEHQVEVNAEIVFAEKEFCSGGKITGDVFIYVDQHSYSDAWYEVKINIKQIYTGRISCDITAEVAYDHFSSFNGSDFEYYVSFLMRDMIDAFKNFLYVNDFDEFKK